MFNILGGFLPVSGVAAFIFGIVLPYVLTVQSAYLATRIIFLGVVLIRFAVLLITDVINGKKIEPLQNRPKLLLKGRWRSPPTRLKILNSNK